MDSVIEKQQGGIIVARNLRGRSFLKLLDFEPSDVRYLLDLAKNFKDLKRTRTPHRYLEGKNIVLLFEKTSTRTRCSFEVAGMDLGMGVTYLDPGSSQMGKKESIEDTAKVLGRMYDGIEYRGFSQKLVEELALYSGVPVWNGLTDDFHPTQMLADLMTMEEHFGHLKGLSCVFMGDARNNVANSLMIACAMTGVNFTACGPRDLFPQAAPLTFFERFFTDLLFRIFRKEFVERRIGDIARYTAKSEFGRESRPSLRVIDFPRIEPRARKARIGK